jgi:two-component system response regulator FixJ
VSGLAVHIVEDDAQVAQSLALAARTAGYDCVIHDSAESFLAIGGAQHAACLVADLCLPGLSGLDLLRAVHETSPDLPVVMVSGHGDVATAVAALKAGAADFLAKPFDAAAFLASLAEAMERSARLALDRRAHEEVRERLERLTGREHEVMELIVGGFSNAEAASRLGISVRTVENHRARIMEKMAAQGLSHLIRMALRLAGVGAHTAGSWRSAGALGSANLAIGHTSPPR